MHRLIYQGSAGIRHKFMAALIQDATIISPVSQTNKLFRLFSDAPSGRYAVVDHSDAYEAAMGGPHGRQLALARLEGVGKDDPPFDPFESMDTIEEEEAEDIAYGDDVVEAEYTEEDDGDGDVEDSDGEEEEPVSIYNRDGSIRRPKSVLATLRAGFPAGGQFAVIELGGSQHKVTTDDLIVVNRLKPVEKYAIGTVHTLKDVLLVGSSHKTLIGMPTVLGAEVDVMVEEITRDAKVIVFKKRRRKNSQRKNGFRRDVTLLRVLDVRMPEEQKNHKHIGRDIVNELASENVMDTATALNTDALSKEALVHDRV